jgi:hypothetical protein
MPKFTHKRGTQHQPLHSGTLVVVCGVVCVCHLLYSVVDGGFLTTKPFIVCLEDEQMDRLNQEEFGMLL